MGTQVKRNHPYQAAGRMWSVRALRLTSLPDGSAAISEEDIQRIHCAIANGICGDPGKLTMADVEFLCDVSRASFTGVAGVLRVHRSTVTRWRQTGEVPGSVMSLVQKKWFWFRLFGDSLGKETVPVDCAINDAKLLSFLQRETIDRELAEPIAPARMSAL